MSLATRSAQEKLEQLKNTPFATVTSGSDAVDPDGLTRTWVVTPNTPIVNTSTVVAMVTWMDQDGAARTVQFSTVVSP